MTPDVLEVALAVARALEAIGAEYYIGGSVASSLQASARSTNDVDFVGDYLDSWAGKLGIAALLARARGEADAPKVL